MLSDQCPVPRGHHCLFWVWCFVTALHVWPQWTFREDIVNSKFANFVFLNPFTINIQMSIKTSESKVKYHIDVEQTWFLITSNMRACLRICDCLNPYFRIVFIITVQHICRWLKLPKPDHQVYSSVNHFNIIIFTIYTFVSTLCNITKNKCYADSHINYIALCLVI